VAGAHALFAPSVEDLFPGGEAEVTRVIPPASLLENSLRPIQAWPFRRRGHRNRPSAGVDSSRSPPARRERTGSNWWSCAGSWRLLVCRCGCRAVPPGAKPTDWPAVLVIATFPRLSAKRASAIPVALLEAAEAWRCGGLSEERLLQSYETGWKPPVCRLTTPSWSGPNPPATPIRSIGVLLCWLWL